MAAEQQLPAPNLRDFVHELDTLVSALPLPESSRAQLEAARSVIPTDDALDVAQAAFQTLLSTDTCPEKEEEIKKLSEQLVSFFEAVENICNFIQQAARVASSVVSVVSPEASAALAVVATTLGRVKDLASFGRENSKTLSTKWVELKATAKTLVGELQSLTNSVVQFFAKLTQKESQSASAPTAAVHAPEQEVPAGEPAQRIASVRPEV